MMLKNILRLTAYSFSKKKPNVDFTKMNIKKHVPLAERTTSSADTPKKDNATDLQQILSEAFENTASKYGISKPQAASPAEVQQIFKNNITTPAPGSLLKRIRKVEDTVTDEHPLGELAETVREQQEVAQKQKVLRSQNVLNELYRGEDGIDTTPVSPEYSMRLNKVLKRMQKEYDLIRRVYENPDYEEMPASKAQELYNYRKEYETESRYNDINQFMNYVEKYPGSRRGPAPQDDPEAFMRYIRNKIPPSLKKEFGLQLTASEAKELGNEDEDVEEVDSYKGSFIDESKIDYPDGNKMPLIASSPDDDLATPGIQNMDNIDLEQDHLEGMDSGVMEHDWNTIPVLPSYETQSYQEDWPLINRWTEFRNRLIGQSFDETMKTIMDEIAEAAKNVPQDKIYPKMGRLYNYYMTLPAEFRDNPAMKALYMGLEYKSPDYTLAEKETALNLMAYKLLPVDAVSEDFVNIHLSMPRRHTLTAFEVEKVLAMKPEFTWDIRDFLEELKQERLRGESRVQEEINVKFPEPAPPQDESQMADLPIEYYDNEDGFWDEHIKFKNQVYEGIPIGRSRPYLKH